MSAAFKRSGLLPSTLLLLGLGLLLIGERIFGQGTARQLSSGLGLLGALGAAALRLRALGAAGGDARKVEESIFAAYCGVALALGLYALSSDSALGLLALESERAARVGGALSALWMAVLAVSLCALVFMEISYSRMPIPQAVELRRVSAAAQAGLTLGLSAVFLLSINYVASERDIRRDVTYFKTTEPSAGTLGMVSRLDRKLRVLLFYRPADDVLGQLKPYFDRLARASRQVSLQVVDFAMQPELARKNRISDNGYVLLLWGEGERQKSRSFQVGVDLTAARAALRKLDGRFQQEFRKITLPERSLVLTVGHGERNSKVEKPQSGDGVEGLDGILKRLNIKSDELGVAQGLASAVPDKASAVAVLGPREKFLPEEAEALLAYLRKGGRLLLMLDPDQEVGLGPLLEGLGLELLPGVVASEKQHLARTYGPSDRTIVFSNSYSSHPAVTTANRHREEVATVLVGAAALERRKTAGLKPEPQVNFPLSGPLGFWRDLDGDFAHGAAEPAQSVNLIAAVTLPTGTKTDQQGRALVIGDGDFATDKVIGNAGNVLVLVDALAWLIADEQLGGEVASEEDIPIEHTRDQDRLWFYATSFAVPLPILAAGIWIARRRRLRSEANR